MIETSGTMSGGGRTVLRGRMGRSVTVHSKNADPDRLAQMETNLQQLQRNANDLQQRQLTLEEQVRTLQPQLYELRLALERTTVELQSLQTEQPLLAEQIKNQEKVVKTSAANPANVKKLKAQVDAKKAEYEKAAEKSKGLETQVDEINKEIKSKTDKKMSGVTKKLKESKSMLEKCKSELVKFGVAIKSAER